MSRLTPAYLEAARILTWYVDQFAPYSIEQAKHIADEERPPRLAFGMLWRAKEWLQTFSDPDVLKACEDDGSEMQECELAVARATVKMLRAKVDDLLAAMDLIAAIAADAPSGKK